MIVTFYGVRGSCPCSSERQRRYGGNTSCVLVEVEGEPPLILDMGTGLRALGSVIESAPDRRAGAPFRANVLLSHLHYDHVLGLPFFRPVQRPGSSLDIHGPAWGGESLAQAFSGVVRPPFFPLHMAEFAGELRFHDLDVDAPAGPCRPDLGAIGVQALPVPHLGPTVGYRVEAGGQVLAYLPDHQAPGPGGAVPEEVLRLCRGADLVVHDAQYTDDEFGTYGDWGHSTVGFAVRVASEAGARRLQLFHHDPAHSDEEIDVMLDDARALAAGRDLEVGAAREGAVVDLGAGVA